MRLKTEFTFPDDFLPDRTGKDSYKIKYLGDTVYKWKEPTGIDPAHGLPILLRRQMQRYDLRLPGDRSEWTALAIHLVMSESDQIDFVDVSDKIAKLLKELNNASDMERLMERIEVLFEIKSDLERRMGIEARTRAGASENASELALEILHGEGGHDGSPS